MDIYLFWIMRLPLQTLQLSQMVGGKVEVGGSEKDHLTLSALHFPAPNYRISELEEPFMIIESSSLDFADEESESWRGAKSKRMVGARNRTQGW